MVESDPELLRGGPIDRGVRARRRQDEVVAVVVLMRMRGSTSQVSSGPYLLPWQALE